MASLISKERRNLGAMIFNEMRRLRISGTRSTPLPFPQLVSLFLKANRIWYLEPNEKLERLPLFGRKQIGKLSVELPLKHPLISTPQKKRKRVDSETQKDEHQSSAPATSAAPSFLGATIQTYLQEVLQNFFVNMSNLNGEFIAEVDLKFQRLCELLTKAHNDMMEFQQAQSQATISILQTINEKLDTLLTHPPSTEHMTTPMPQPPTSDPPHPATTSPPSPHVPSATHDHILFSVTEPGSTSQVHVTYTTAEPTQVASPTHSQSSTHTESLHTGHITPPASPLFVPDPSDTLHIPPLVLPHPPADSRDPTLAQEVGDTIDDASSLPSTPLLPIQSHLAIPAAPLRTRPASPSGSPLSDVDKKGEKTSSPSEH